MYSKNLMKKDLEEFNKMIFVEDDMHDWEKIVGENPEEVLQKVLDVIRDKFDI
jgi:hypothetical protein